MPIHGPRCPYCKGRSRLAPNSAMYGPNVPRPHNVWLCENFPECDTWIGVYPNDPNATPVGTMAGPRLRKLRTRIHDLIKPLYADGRSTRTKATRDTARKLGWGDMNVSALNEDACLKVITLLNPGFAETAETETRPSRTWQDERD